MCRNTSTVNKTGELAGTCTPASQSCIHACKYLSTWKCTESPILEINPIYMDRANTISKTEFANKKTQRHICRVSNTWKGIGNKQETATRQLMFRPKPNESHKTLINDRHSRDLFEKKIYQNKSMIWGKTYVRTEPKEEGKPSSMRSASPVEVYRDYPTYIQLGKYNKIYQS
jgi:hypothetical protein